MLAENVNRALAGLPGKAFGHQKLALESTLRRFQVFVPSLPNFGREFDLSV